LALEKKIAKQAEEKSIEIRDQICRIIEPYTGKAYGDAWRLVNGTFKFHPADQAAHYIGDAVQAICRSLIPMIEEKIADRLIDADKCRS
jgi:hypothetical protein